MIDIDNRIDEAEPGISSPGRHTCPRRIAPSRCAQRSLHLPLGHDILYLPPRATPWDDNQGIGLVTFFR